MQNAKCKMQNVKWRRPLLTACSVLHFAFCILHFDFFLAGGTGRTRRRTTGYLRGIRRPACEGEKHGAATRPPSRLSKVCLCRRAARLREVEGDKPNAGRAIKPASGIATGMASLAVVLGLFLAAAWAVRRGMPAGPAKLPGEVVEVLGRTPLTGRQFAHLIRCGNKLLLVHLAPGSAETLTEITDPVEVDRLAGLCRQAHPHSATTSFRQVFQQFSRQESEERREEFKIYAVLRATRTGAAAG